MRETGNYCRTDSALPQSSRGRSAQQRGLGEVAGVGAVGGLGGAGGLGGDTIGGGGVVARDPRAYIHTQIHTYMNTYILLLPRAQSPGGRAPSTNEFQAAPN